MKASLIYSERFQHYDYGGGHPLKMIRLKLTYELLRAYGVFEAEGVELVEAHACTRKEAEKVHRHEYLDILSAIDEGMAPHELYRYGLGSGDCPAFHGVYAGSMLATGGSMQAARLVSKGKSRAAFNIAGGLHHAMPGRASGFCYINDPAVAIKYLAEKGMKVAYVDIDAHHGDGVEHVFYDTDQVLTVSIHENGHYLFPGTGFPSNVGLGKGRGYAVNLPLPPGTVDEVFTFGFFELVPPLIEAFKPDILVTQLGCDNFMTDPLTHLGLTTNGFVKAVEGFRDFKLPWVALGGGGYNVLNVARAWALSFGVMAGIALPNELPASYLELANELGNTGELLRDEYIEARPSELKSQRLAVEDMLLEVKRTIFPLHGIKV